MEATERALFESGVRRATEATDGAALDSALDDLGWRDALEADRPTAVSVLFESQGATTTTSAALDWLLATALGADADGAGVAVVLPSLRTVRPPGTSGRGLVRRRRARDRSSRPLRHRTRRGRRRPMVPPPSPSTWDS